MKLTLNQEIDYSSLVSKIECKGVAIPKQKTSLFLKKCSGNLIDFKNTKRVLPKDEKQNYILFQAETGRFI